MPNQLTIVKTIYGSRLFGLDTETSDKDFKGIFQASLSDIILGQDVKTINQSTNGDKAKNQTTDTDFELKELRTFVNDCLEGQVYALEMLFTPFDCILESSPVWQFIQTNRSKLIPRDLKAFSSYAFGHSAKYSLRGERLQELQRVITWLDYHRQQNPKSKLREIVHTLQLSDYVFTDIYKHKLKNQTYPDEERLCCLGMILQYNKPITECLQILNRRLEQFGNNYSPKEEIDWKAYSHVLRLLSEWEQLLTNSNIVFPLANKDFILSVKKGEVDLSLVQDKIFDEYVRISQLPNNLPEPDTVFWQNWLVSHYTQRQLIF